MEKTGFENLRVYKLAEEMGDLAWKVVKKLESFITGYSWKTAH